MCSRTEARAKKLARCTIDAGMLKHGRTSRWIVWLSSGEGDVKLVSPQQPVNLECPMVIGVTSLCPTAGPGKSFFDERTVLRMPGW